MQIDIKPGMKILESGVTAYSNEHEFTTDVDISSTDFWYGQSFNQRDKSFARLRAEAPVSWHRPMQVSYPTDERGFWAVTRAADIAEASMNAEVFQSKYGISLDAVPPFRPRASTFFLTMDAPEHSRFRGLVSAAFTPKAIRRITDRIEMTARDIVDQLVGAGDIEFVSACSSQLPLATVSDIVGVPVSLRRRVAAAAENLAGGGQTATLPPEQRLEFIQAQWDFLHQVGADLAAHRRAHPGEDLMTDLVQAEIDGVRLSDDDIGEFMILMSVAGNDTTKQTTTRAALALQADPAQRAWLMEDFEGRIMGAIEEFVRYASPVMHFARTAARDTTLGGVNVSAGDKVLLLYCSGNRDESVWPSPGVFDLGRTKAPHVGFGGGGPHFCLGNGVAKTQLRAIFRELLTRVPDVEFGEPKPLASHIFNGIEALPAYVP